MGRTKFDRLDVGRDDVVVFRMSGTLGFHENDKVRRLAGECLKRDFTKVIFDFTDLSSLGGGVARILRDFVNRFEKKEGEVGFIVTNDVVLEFLQDGRTSFYTYRSLEEALEGEVPDGAADPSGEKAPEDSTAEAPERNGESRHPSGGSADDGHQRDEPARAPAEPAQTGAETEGNKVTAEGVIEMSYDAAASSDHQRPGQAAPADTVAHADEAAPAGQAAPADTVAHADEAAPAASGGDDDLHGGEEDARPGTAGGGAVDSEYVFTEIFGDGPSVEPPAWIDKPTSPFDESGKHRRSEDDRVYNLNRKLKRRILELKTLFSIGKDFNSIRDRKKLLDIFLLTSIAQGGVESAVLFERREDAFSPVMSKGLDIDHLESVVISPMEKMNEDDSSIVVQLDDFEMDPLERDILKKAGLEHICPFWQEGQLTALVLLGKRIAGRGMKREDFEFLRILVTLAQGACENAVMFEREHERTLGIVKTLISLIEENTLLKGTSEFVSRYVGIVAKDMGYREEAFKDLIYGTVLRDMGMIKVSDLIVRCPRDLTKEEWEIIKKHPEDGAAMLRRMKFNNNVVEIVKAHHERFNGEGYPMGLVGKEIPLGSRIISVVESYAAMIHERPNRPALSEREALETLKENYGLRYDREVVQCFAKIMEREIAKSVRPGVPVG